MAGIVLRLGSEGYAIHVGRGLYETVLAQTLVGMDPARIVLASHPDILELHGSRLEDALRGMTAGDTSMMHFTFPPGEENKSLLTLERGYVALLEAGVTREDVVLAFGGGVVGDLAGFLAASYMRGVRYLQVPTTLMAMVDSSIGGKVGIDLPGAKNAVGCFHQPVAVVSDIGVLKTLPQREVNSGLAEVAKYGFLYDVELLSMLRIWESERSFEGTAIEKIIARCAGHKAEVVRQDERDVIGIRALLNYGHTFGHALESACGYQALRHGEAVALGMMMAARAAEMDGMAAGGLLELHRDVLMPLIAQVEAPEGLEVEVVLRRMLADKKRGRRQRFVLLEAPGEPRIVDSLDEDIVRRAVEEILRETWGMER
jgi:3-dehydroquinate synthase